ncbi:hypothetical protein THIX_20762 [Thiomonas sp. X19]|nr:hypothetical protein THIX_20762 [Thiomonas sp. X19]
MGENTLRLGRRPARRTRFRLRRLAWRHAFSRFVRACQSLTGFNASDLLHGPVAFAARLARRTPGGVERCRHSNRDNTAQAPPTRAHRAGA